MMKRKKHSRHVALLLLFCAFFLARSLPSYKEKKKPFNNKSGVMLHLRVCMLTYVYTSLIWAELAAFTKTAHTMTRETILCWTGVCVCVCLTLKYQRKGTGMHLAHMQVTV